MSKLAAFQFATIDVPLQTPLMLSVTACLLAGCGKANQVPPPAAPEPVIAPAKIANFDVAKLTSKYGVASKEEYIHVAGLRNEPFRVAVLATWCPYSQQFLEHARNDPEIAAEYLLVVYEDEFLRKVKSEERDGNITSIDATALIAAPENKGRMVWDANEVLRFGLPIYVVRSGTFMSEVTGFPTRLTCSQGACSKAGLAFSEAKSIARSDPELLARIKENLPATERHRVESNPELLVTNVARVIQQRSEK